MTFRGLVAIPTLGALAVALLSFPLGGGEAYWSLEQTALHLLGLAGCIAAASALDRRDWMFRAWALYALAFALQAAWRLLTGPEADPTVAAPQPVVGLAYLVVLNTVAVAGSLLFVLAFRRAGLAIPGSPARALVEFGAVGLVAVALGAPTLIVTLREAEGAAAVARALAWLLGDVLCFVLVAPLWRIARAFSGGALAWPWAFLGVCNLGYLAYDAAMVLGAAAGLEGPGTVHRAVSEALYAASSLAALSAGLAHRRAVQATRSALARTS